MEIFLIGIKLAQKLKNMKRLLEFLPRIKGLRMVMQRGNLLPRELKDHFKIPALLKKPE